MQSLFEVMKEIQPLYRRLLVGALMSGGGLAFWLLCYSPLLREKEIVEAEANSLFSEYERLEQAQHNLPVLMAEVAKLREGLARAGSELPDQREIPELLSSVSDRARDTGLEVQLFRPTEEVFRDFYAEVPVLFSVRGNFHQLASFFDKVGKLDRIVTISGISIKDSSVGNQTGERSPLAAKTSDLESRRDEKEGGRQTEAGCTVTTFRILDEEEKAHTPTVRRDGRSSPSH